MTKVYNTKTGEELQQKPKLTKKQRADLHNLRYKKIKIKPDLKLPIGIMGPLNTQDNSNNNPMPVIIALPGGYMDHVSEFYKALCPENHNCLIIVPFLPDNEL